MAKCPKCGYDPDRNIEMEKAKALQEEIKQYNKKLRNI